MVVVFDTNLSLSSFFPICSRFYPILFSTIVSLIHNLPFTFTTKPYQSFYISLLNLQLYDLRLILRLPLYLMTIIGYTSCPVHSCFYLANSPIFLALRLLPNFIFNISHSLRPLNQFSGIFQ